jgi:hypothetical protein
LPGQCRGWQGDHHEQPDLTSAVREELKDDAAIADGRWRIASSGVQRSTLVRPAPRPAAAPRRWRRRAALLSVVAVLAAAGCRGTGPPAPAGSTRPRPAGGNGETTASTPPTDGHPIAARLAALEAATCACTTMSCAVTVDGERAAWVRDHLEEILRYLDGPTRAAEAEAGGKRVLACHQRIRDAATPEERAPYDAEMSGTSPR